VQISERGLSVQLQDDPSTDLIGIEVEIVIGFTAMPSACTKGIVRRIGGEGGRVLEIVFTDLPCSTLEAIRAYVARRDERPSARFRISG